MHEQAAVGIDIARASSWLERNVPGSEAPFVFHQIEGGRSNLTFEVRDAGDRLMVLRRPPLHGVLQSAHDMSREFRVMKALGSTGLPVPRTIALCEDPEVLGAPFYVMEFMRGLVLRNPSEIAAHFDVEQRPRLADRLVEALWQLHSLDPDAVGLGGLGRREGYLARQLRRWQGQWEASRTRTVEEVDRAYELLKARLPGESRQAIVHGDYRLDNVAFTPLGEIEAIFDWELATLGDPLADLGVLLAYWVEPGEDADYLLGLTPTLAPGFPSRRDLAERYAEVSGTDIADISYYLGFARWKLACVVEGIVARYRSGAMGDSVIDLEMMEAQTRLLAIGALEALAV